MMNKKNKFIYLFLLCFLASSPAFGEEKSISEINLSSVCGVQFTIDQDDGMRRATGQPQGSHVFPLVGLWGPVDAYKKAHVFVDLRPENKTHSMECLVNVGKWMTDNEKVWGDVERFFEKGVSTLKSGEHSKKTFGKASFDLEQRDGVTAILKVTVK